MVSSHGLSVTPQVISSYRGGKIFFTMKRADERTITKCLNLVLVGKEPEITCLARASQCHLCDRPARTLTRVHTDPASPGSEMLLP